MTNGSNDATPSSAQPWNLWSGLEPPLGRIRPHALVRWLEVVAWLAAAGEPGWDVAALAAQTRALTKDALEDATPPRGSWQTHAFYAAVAAGRAIGPPTLMSHTWSVALLASLRVLWPAGATRSFKEDEAFYRASLAVRQLLAMPQWMDVHGPQPEARAVQPEGLYAELVEAMTKPAASAQDDRLVGTFKGLAQLMQRRAQDVARAAQAHQAEHGDTGRTTSTAAGLVEEIPLPAWLIAGVEEGKIAADRVPAPQLTVHVATPAAFVDLACDPVRQVHLTEDLEAERCTRRTRPGKLTTIEYAVLWRAVAACDLSPAARAAARASLLVAAHVGIAWERFGDQARALDAQAWPDLSAPPIPAAGLALFRAHPSEPWRGVRVVPLVALPPPPHGADASALYPAAERLVLPLDDALAEALAAALLATSQAEQERDAAGCLRLTWERGALGLRHYDAARARVSRHLPRHRIDPGRLPFLLRGVLRHRCDADDVDLATLAGYEDIASNAQHYVSVDVERLAQRYLTAQRCIGALVGLEAALPQAPMPFAGQERVGARRVPRPETMRRAAHLLKAHMDASQPELLSQPARWVAHHNARVNRWAFLLHAGLALRRRQDALHDLGPSDCDASHGWCVVADKGLLRRLLPWGTALHAHWNDWGRWLDELQSAARDWSPASVRVVAAMARCWRKAQLGPASLQRLELHNGLLVPQPWRPQDLDAALANAGLHVPTQLWRHGALTFWRDAGVRQEDIEALAGHYQYGREPWHAFTLEDGACLVRRLGAHVDRALAALGAGT